MLPVGATGSVWDKFSTPTFIHLTVPKELPNVPEAIVQDRQGFIWIGTQAGLVRWDGYRSRIFLHEDGNPHSLPDDFVVGLTLDSSGAMLVGTAAGIFARYDPHTESFTALPAAPSGGYAVFICDDSGGVWLGNANGLAFLPEGGQQWRSIPLPGDNKVASLLFGRDGTLYVGTDHGLLRRPPGVETFASLDSIRPPAATTRNRISALYEAPDGALWYGTGIGQLGIWRPDGSNQTIGLIGQGKAIKSIVPTPRDIVAVGTFGNGLTLFERDSGKPIRSIQANPLRPSGLSHNSMNCIYVDRAGGLWIGTFRGVDYQPSADPAFQALLPLSPEPEAGSDINTALLAEDDGRIWIPTNGVLAELLDPHLGRIEALATSVPDGRNSLPGLDLVNLIRADGQIWAATGRGLFKRSERGLQHVDALGDNPVKSLDLIGDDLWIGSPRQGIARYDLKQGRVERFEHDPANDNSLSDNAVNVITHDSHGRLWIGTQNGLSAMDLRSHQFYRFSHRTNDPNGLPGDFITSLFVDRRQKLWVTTSGGGIGILDCNEETPRKFIHLNHEQGLPVDAVDKVLEDDLGRIWASTDNGLVLIDPDSLAVQVFGLADGVPIIAFWSDSGAKTRDGSLFFSGIGGVTIVSPDRLSGWDYHPQVVVTDVRVDGASRPGGDRVVLSAGDRSLQIEFAALDFSAPEKNRYQFRLEGIDESWINTDHDHRLAAYSNLEPGQYRLAIRGSNRNGQWTEPATYYPVIVLPKWYQRLWFKAVTAVAMLMAILAIVQVRTAYLLRRQRVLEERVAQRTGELRAAKDRLEQLASEDSLTGIANRRVFDSVLATEIERARRAEKPLSLLMIDVDCFKAYNDHYGHLGGDEALRSIAHLCKSQLRRPGDLIARYGGEEFAVILPETQEDAGKMLAEAMLEAVRSAAIPHRGSTISDRLTISIGVAAQAPGQTLDREFLIAAADTALYRAKLLGRNRVVAASDLH